MERQIVIKIEGEQSYVDRVAQLFYEHYRHVLNIMVVFDPPQVTLDYRIDGKVPE